MASLTPIDKMALECFDELLDGEPLRIPSSDADAAFRRLDNFEKSDICGDAVVPDVPI